MHIFIIKNICKYDSSQKLLPQRFFTLQREFLEFLKLNLLSNVLRYQFKNIYSSEELAKTVAINNILLKTLLTNYDNNEQNYLYILKSQFYTLAGGKEENHHIYEYLILLWNHQQCSAYIRNITQCNKSKLHYNGCCTKKEEEKKCYNNIKY